MKVKRIVVDKKPDNCIACPLCWRKDCGMERHVQVSSSSSYKEKIPDKRCLVREQ